MKQFKAVVNKVVGAIRKGVDAFKNIIHGEFNLKEITDQFVESVKEIPEKVNPRLLFYKSTKAKLRLMHTYM